MNIDDVSRPAASIIVGERPFPDLNNLLFSPEDKFKIALRQLIESDELMIVTVTSTPERRDAIIAEVLDNPWYPAFRVMDYGELVHLL